MSNGDVVAVETRAPIGSTLHYSCPPDNQGYGLYDGRGNLTTDWRGCYGNTYRIAY
jgi:hypothetical protein